MAVTLKEIAKIAQVSDSAVSAVLNGSASSIRVSQETRQRILKTASLLGYVPNYLARGLRGGKTNSVAVLWSLYDWSGVYFLRRLSQKLYRHNYFIKPFDHLSDPSLISEVLIHLRQKGTDAVVIQGSKELIENESVFQKLTQFPSVLVVGSDQEHWPFDLVVRDTAKPYYAIAKYFYATGRKKPAFLGSVSPNRKKIAALKDGFKECGLEQDVLIIDYSSSENFVNSDLILFLEKQFPKEIPFDCISCTNDFLAGAVMKWLTMRRVKIPQDVAVFGFDNAPFSELLTPPLASVERHEAKLADIVAEILIDKVSGQSQSAPRRDKVEMEIILRASAG